jgi:hypothetical protein
LTARSAEGDARRVGVSEHSSELAEWGDAGDP